MDGITKDQAILILIGIGIGLILLAAYMVGHWYGATNAVNHYESIMRNCICNNGSMVFEKIIK